jgi:hypothetical protein
MLAFLMKDVVSLATSVYLFKQDLLRVTLADESARHESHEHRARKSPDLVRHDRDFGSGTTPASIEMAEVRARKRSMVGGLVSTHMDKYKRAAPNWSLERAASLDRRPFRFN